MKVAMKGRVKSYAIRKGKVQLVAEVTDVDNIEQLTKFITGDLPATIIVSNEEREEGVGISS